jgi:tetratricopeptide (TPR) repeat protein
MNSLLLVAALIVLAVCVVGVVVLARRYNDVLEERRRSAARRAAEGTTIIEAQTRQQGDSTVAETAPPPPPWYARPGTRNGALAALALLLGVGALFALSGQFASRGDRLVVLVAPFADGGGGGTGRNVAADLARQLAQQSRGEIDTSVAGSTPATPEEALALASAAGADLLIWGDVEPGGVLDSPSLSPRLIYTPTGVYGPNGWDGYAGRFAMPRSYTLSREPINGRAVVVPLVLALADYARGAPDVAYEQLGLLLENYPALVPTLPRAIRGNILWARTFYAEAADEYRRARAEPSDEPALLANNLGAILLDAGDPAALAAFQEAVNLLGGRDLGELRYNLAVLALREGRNADAADSLEQARNLMPAATPLLLDLATAYRETGRLDQAAATLAAAERQASADLAALPAAYRATSGERFQADIAEQQALLDLARLAGARGPLLWELDVVQPLPVNRLSDMRRRLEIAADTSDNRVANWRKRATSDGASGYGSGLVATGQAERAELSADRQRFYTAVVDSELGRAQSGRPTSAWDALFGNRGASSHITLLEQLQGRYPNSAQIAATLGRARRIAGDLDGADAALDAAVRLAPQAPEGYFGKGQVALARDDRGRAAELFNLALQRDAAFFPSHYALAAIDEEADDFAGAVNERRALSQLRPGPASTIDLARTLRLSGPAGYGEAEQVLRELSTTNADAAVELGRLYNDAGRSEAAIKAYQDALRLQPASAVAAFELGETYARAGNTAEAERLLTQAVNSDPDNVDARLALANLYQGPLNDPRRAEREYRRALDTGVQDPETLAQIGDAALGTGNYAQAIDAYGAAVQADGNNASYRYRLARAYLEADRLRPAGEQANLALPLAGDPALRADILTLQGDVARLSGDAQGAVSAYAQALQLNPSQIGAELGQGLIAVGQGNWGVASGYFQSAAALPGADRDPLAQFWLGEALLRQGSYGAATEAYNRAIALQEPFPAAYLGLAQVQYAQGGPDAAATALRTVATAVQQQPGYAEALLFQGKLLQELGRTNEAEAAYSASIRANGDIAETYFRRGMIEVQSGRYDGAVRDFRQATRLQENFPEANYWLGRAYYAQGRNEQARDAFQRAVALNGNYVEALFYMGLVSEDLGRTAEAVSAYQTVIALDPGGELAGRARAQIAKLT